MHHACRSHLVIGQKGPGYLQGRKNKIIYRAERTGLFTGKKGQGYLEEGRVIYREGQACLQGGRDRVNLQGRRDKVIHRYEGTGLYTGRAEGQVYLPGGRNKVIYRAEGIFTGMKGQGYLHARKDTVIYRAELFTGQKDLLATIPLILPINNPEPSAL